MDENIVSGVVINGPDEESLRFYTWSRQDLLEWAVINEYLKKGTPIPFRFKKEFFFWKHIEKIIRYFDSNAEIKKIKMITKYSEYELSNINEFLAIPDLCGDVLHQFEISTRNPSVTMEMRDTNVSADIAEDVPDKMMEDISNMLNRSRRPNAWVSFGGSIWILD